MGIQIVEYLFSIYFLFEINETAFVSFSSVVTEPAGSQLKCLMFDDGFEQKLQHFFVQLSA